MRRVVPGQLALFYADEDDPPSMCPPPLLDAEPYGPIMVEVDPVQAGCLFPNHAPLGGYRLGCRCPRCKTARSAARIKNATITTCQHDGCSKPRVKGVYFCEDHRPQPGNVRGRWGSRETTRIDAHCVLCGHDFVEYGCQLDQYARPELVGYMTSVCRPCRGPYKHRVRNHHLNADWALRLHTVECCDCCFVEFPRSGEARGKAIQIDHNHACCPRENSCGACVRGFLCLHCNTSLAPLERNGQDWADRAVAYLNRSRL